MIAAGPLDPWVEWLSRVRQPFGTGDRRVGAEVLSCCGVLNPFVRPGAEIQQTYSGVTFCALLHKRLLEPFALTFLRITRASVMAATQETMADPAAIFPAPFYASNPNSLTARCGRL